MVSSGASCTRCTCVDRTEAPGEPHRHRCPCYGDRLPTFGPPVGFAAGSGRYPAPKMAARVRNLGIDADVERPAPAIPSSAFYVLLGRTPGCRVRILNRPFTDALDRGTGSGSGCFVGSATA